MKHRKIKDMSVKWKIFSYMTIFCAIMVVLLWVFQVLFLDDFYKMIKTRTVKNTANDAVDVLITEESYTELLNTLAKQNDVCIKVVDEDGLELFTNIEDNQCSIVTVKKVNELIENAKQEGDSSFTYINNDINKTDVKEAGKEEWKNDPNHNFMIPKGRPMQGMTQINKVELLNGTNANVVVYAEITPVNATVGTIRTQILIITVILFLVALLLGYIMSKKIAKPIIKINDGAKLLAKGNYEVQFEGSGYLEIAELNNTLNYASKELAKVENLRRELIANMSHDLRTPLTMISGYGELMRDIPGENTPDNIQIIIDETNRLTNMVNDILDLSKIQSGSQSLVISCFNITKLIQDVILRYQKMLMEQPYEFEFVFDSEIFVHGDEGKLSQVLYNLLNNAIHYCGEDHKIIIRQTMLGNRVKVEVIDHGDGIEEEDLPYVWDRYYKVDKTHARAKVGSGLGLSIVKGILDLHHAEYGVSSLKQEGSTFWFILNLTKN